MEISVIIPAKDASKTLPACLISLQQQENFSAGKDYEVIVIDDGSSDRTAEIAREYGAQVYSQPNAGPASARNHGVRCSSGEIVVFTDSDCTPARDWLLNMVHPFQDARVMGVKGTYKTNERNLIARFVQLEYESKYDRMRKLEQIDFIDTYSAAYRRSVFLENGGFNEVFPVPSVEDQEFSFRLATKGYRLVFCPHAVVYHSHDLSIREYFKRKLDIGYWKAIMLNWLPEKALDDSHTLPSQRWQIILLGGLLLGLFFWPFWWLGAFVFLVSLILFMVSSLPFQTSIFQKDRQVLLIALPLILIRSLGLGLGLVAGFLFPPKKILKHRQGLSLMERMLKRAVDLIGGCIGLLLSLPMCLILGLAIRLDSPGPVFYSQRRAGENGKPFSIHKLRTMVDGADQKLDEVMNQNQLKGPVFKIQNDNRVTRMGRFLRRWSLDELPQFWNVVRGEMSLVGPRPEEVWIVEQYGDSQRQRLLVKPGMTGPMQISGRGLLDMDARLHLEMDYLKNYSFWKDLWILARSIRAILRGEGAF